MNSSVQVDDAQPDTVVLTATDTSTVIDSTQENPAAQVLFPSSASPLTVPDQEEPSAGDKILEDNQDIDTFIGASYYWDASTMAPLNATSAAAIARLRAYKPPPFPLWDRLPVNRRAAVLMLLYADRKGDLRVVITMRAASLRSFSGHAAFPGGKADSSDETPYQIARREAWEEIGLPMDDAKIPAPFSIEPLCYLPFSLARTELVVRPCIALLHAGTQSSSPSSDPGQVPTVEEALIPRLDAKEVAAVFSAPFHNFLRRTDEIPPTTATTQPPPPPPPGLWYEGNWTEWNSYPWRLHFFYVPVTDQHVSRPRSDNGRLLEPATTSGEAVAEQTQADELEVDEHPGRYKVWGMTARMLVDAARVAYGEEPEFEHNDHYGDEDMIMEMEKMGRLGPKQKRWEEKI